MEKAKEVVDAVSTDVVEVLKEMRRGQCLYELAAALDRLVGMVRARGTAGAVVLKLKIEPQAEEEGVVTVTDEIDVREPKQKRAKSIFFTTERNKLTRHDPRQREFTGDGFKA